MKRQSSNIHKGSDSEDKIFDMTASSYEDVPSENSGSGDKNDISFTQMLNSPEMSQKTNATCGKTAINSRAQVVTNDLFKGMGTTSKPISINSKKRVQKKEILYKKKTESWYCKACQEDRVSDMRLCVICKSYLHDGYSRFIHQTIMTVRNILLLSSSRVHGYEYLECARDDINNLFRKANVSTILFIPYALKNQDKYFNMVEPVLSKWGYVVNGIHKGDPKTLVKQAQAIFIGGGNTFLLLKSLYDNGLVDIIRHRVLQEGVPYLGSSAGTNVATTSICTTNDMPIVYPPSFEGLQLVPFNINPHYMDHDPTTKHKGETREERILQYQELAQSGVVIGLREGSSILIEGNKITLKGISKSRLFIPGKIPKEIEIGSDLSYLL
ncbi:hypothetical protein FQA39_LY11167 [Lamprigera yunnana]|nr:hypothetical protein FQA39_LY11167 [Lamprigera yunnana]